ncbi:MAG: hypothetical protein K6F37_06395 [Lachnospiraceae bacterium]|nr:hypothetical protein [Lachnospiraceae bacterium]
MLGILITVLKIIGIVLLVIIGLVLAILLCLLFVPLRYGIWVNSTEDSGWNVSGKFTYLLHMLSLSLAYEENLRFRFKLFGFTVLSSDSKPKKKVKKKKESASKDVQTDSIENKDEVMDTAKQDSVREPEKENVEKPDIKPENKELKSNKEKKKEKSKAKKEKKDKKGNGIKDILAFINENDIKYYIHFFGQQMAYLLNKLKPKTVDCDVRFALDNPAHTGWITGLLATVKWIYKKNVRVIPDFTSDKMFLYGNIYLRGSMRLVTVVIILLRCWFDKRVRELIKKVL